MTRRLSIAARITALAVAYAVAARAGLLLDAVGGLATLVWAPTGISLAALLLGGSSLWPGVALGAFVANVWAGAPAELALPIAVGNTLEALAGATLLRAAGFRPELDRIRDVLLLVFGAAVATTAVSATVGATALSWSGRVEPGRFAESWRTWWIGDALGDLVVAPMLLAWGSSRRQRIRAARIAEATALTLALLAVGAAVFFGEPGLAGVSPLRQPYLVFPFLLWGALRFGPRGAATATFVLSTVAVAGAVGGRGPFAHETLSASLLLLQSFTALVAVTMLLLGAAIAERGLAIQRREEFLELVSHDLKNPLSTMRFSLDLLRRKLAGDGLLGPVEAALGSLERATFRMETLVRDILDLSALEAGRLEIERKVLDVGEILREAAENGRAQAARKGITVSVEAPSSPAKVDGDRRRLLQVLGNLVDNAIKYGNEGGTVVVRATSVDGSIRLSVVDDGPGIDPRELPHVFERFWRARRGAQEGSGLGLSIVKVLVEAHGGRVWAESEPGRGSAFHVELPRNAPLLHQAKRGPGFWRRFRAATLPDGGRTADERSVG